LSAIAHSTEGYLSTHYRVRSGEVAELMKKPFLPILNLAVLFTFSGCGQPAAEEDEGGADGRDPSVVEGLASDPNPEPQDPPTRDVPPPKKTSQPLAVHNTGDKGIVWPDYDLPLIHGFPVPAVPEQIEGPTEWRQLTDPQASSDG
jgi:hypothetical protein